MAKLLTITDVAEQLQISDKTIYNWVNKKRIPYIKVCGAVRFDAATIEKWLNERKIKATIGGKAI